MGYGTRNGRHWEQSEKGIEILTSPIVWTSHIINLEGDNHSPSDAYIDEDPRLGGPGQGGSIDRMGMLFFWCCFLLLFFFSFFGETKISA